jgi:hypothetical protein
LVGIGEPPGGTIATSVARPGTTVPKGTRGVDAPVERASAVRVAAVLTGGGALVEPQRAAVTMISPRSSANTIAIMSWFLALLIAGSSSLGTGKM